MAKQVILAHPFERISGNVTRSKQALVYAENDNPAWEAPHTRQYARNFKPQMNLRYDAASGKTSFTIQTKSAVDNTEAGRLRLALFGGSQAVKNAIKKNPTLLAQAYEAYVEVRAYFISFDSFIAKEVYKGLKTKAASILLGNSTGDGIYVNNPWVAGGTGTNVTISNDILLKFAQYLCVVVLKINGKSLVSKVLNLEQPGYRWGTVIDGIIDGAGEIKKDEMSLDERTIEGETVNVVIYSGEDVYSSDGTLQTEDDSAESGAIYTTTPPNA